MLRTALTTALLASGAPAAAQAHATFGVRDGQGRDFTVTDVASGAMTVRSVAMVPPHKWDSWKAGTPALVTVAGTTAKQILAGTFKWQLYETGVTSFIASGDAPFFRCDNKGCDPAAPVALRWKQGTKGDFTLELSAALPEAKGKDKRFKLVLWAEDQDHEPYDFSATINFSYDGGSGGSSSDGAIDTFDTFDTFSAAVSGEKKEQKAAAAAARLAPAQFTVHHADNGLGSGGDAHCSEITITNPATNQYWGAHSYQYPGALWPRGGCDRTKYNFFNRKKEIAAGVSMTTLGIHSKEEREERGVGAAAQDNALAQRDFYAAQAAKHDNAHKQADYYAAAVKALEEASSSSSSSFSTAESVKKTFLRGVQAKLQQQEAAQADDDDWSTIFMITNPSSPLGKQHCQELDNPGGKSSKYWADKGWKYSSPPWKAGKCDRNRFNYVNREMQNLDGFEGVTFWYLGIQV
jgi:hypothetical protein